MACWVHLVGRSVGRSLGDWVGCGLVCTVDGYSVGETLNVWVVRCVL